MDTAVNEHSEVYGIKKGYRVNIERIDCYYKGQKRDIELDIVMGYCKGTQIELIQVLKGEEKVESR